MSIVTRDEDTDIIDVGREVTDNGHALIALNSSEINTQITTAKAYPRSLTQFREDAMAMACMDEETAGSMFYVLPARKGSDKRIEGPSVRLAEVVGSSWGNLRYGARIVEEGEKFVTAQGMCFDLEKNIAINIEVKRSIWGKYGRFSQDMIQVTCNAACSIALRQAIFKVVPRMFVDILYQRAREVAVGQADSTEKRRHKLREWFKKFGVTDEQLLGLVQKDGFEDLNEDDLVTLRGIATALKDGDTTVEQIFDRPESIVAKVTRSKTNDKLAQDSQKPQDESTLPTVAPAGDFGECDSEAYLTFESRIAETDTPLGLNQIAAEIKAVSMSANQRKGLDGMVNQRKKELK